MPHPAPTEMPASPVPKELPESFFSGMADPELPHRRAEFKGTPQTGTQPMRAIILYDAIIDDIFEHPNTPLQDCAARIGRSASTVSLVVKSDFFRARWLQRREQFNEALNFRLHSKMVAVVEKSLDNTLQQLKNKPNIPLPVLNEINESMLDRLGYGPSGSGGGPTVVVNNNTSAVAGAVANAQATPDGLARARQYLQILEEHNASSGASPGNASQPKSDGLGSEAGPVVEGEARRVNP